MGAKDRGILIACIGAVSAILAAFAEPICAIFTDSDKPAVASSDAPNPPGTQRPLAFDPAQPITPTPNTPTIEGAWKQYAIVPEMDPVYLGTFVVSRYKGEWVMSPRTQTEGDDRVNTLGIFDVSYDGQRWTFNSNWGQTEGVGNFELDRVSPTVFEGEIRVAGRIPNRTRWVKVE